MQGGKGHRACRTSPSPDTHTIAITSRSSRGLQVRHEKGFELKTTMKTGPGVWSVAIATVMARHIASGEPARASSAGVRVLEPWAFSCNGYGNPMHKCHRKMLVRHLFKGSWKNQGGEEHAEGATGLPGYNPSKPYVKTPCPKLQEVLQ